MSGQKTVWILTYSGTPITAQMLKDNSRIMADECHSTTDGAVNYTYLHLSRRCRQHAIAQFTKKAGIELKELFGYDLGSAAIRNHPAVALLRKHHKEQNPAFIPSTNGEPVVTKGPLSRDAPSKKQKKQDLIRHIATLEQEVAALKAGNDALMAENAALKK